MFKKLRLQFLLLIMTIITIVMVISFTFVYIITNQNILSENHQRLDSVVLEHTYASSFPNADHDEMLVWTFEDNSTSFDTYIFMRLNEQNNLTQLNTTAPFEMDFYNDFVQNRLGAMQSGDIVQLEDRQWLTYVNTAENERIFAMLDITDRMTILQDLLVTFTTIGVGMLMLIFCISLIFSTYTVKPVEQAWNKQKQFIADASHELKTPLAIISANLSAMKAKPAASEKFTGYIEVQTKRMSGLITHLLTLAKYDNLTINSDVKLVNLSEMVLNTILNIEVLAYEKGIDITYDIDSNIYLLSNEEKIVQLLTLLLDNALKYGDHGKKIVLLSLKKQLKTIVLEMSNYVDIDKNLNLEKLFDRFYRADDARVYKEGGYGLGLSIAKVIVEELNGQLSARLDEDQIIFTITLKFTSNQW